VSCLLISREAWENGNGIKGLFKIFGGLVKGTAGRGLPATIYLMNLFFAGGNPLMPFYLRNSGTNV
jgi:hypothetical protein